MKNLERVSRWIRIDVEYITSRHKLWSYADKYDVETDKKAPVMYFRYNNDKYAICQFLSRYNPFYGFDLDCKEYPAFISGVDTENYYNPLYCEISNDGNYIRLYREV